MRSAISLLAVFGLLAFSTWSFAQETAGNLEGRVLDETGKPVLYANISANGPSLQGTRATITASDGRFSILALPVGSYTVRISHISFRDLAFEDVHVRLGKTASLGEIRLIQRLHEAPELIVTAERPLLDPVSTVLGDNIELEEFEVLPLERNYRNTAVLLPHANESFLGDDINFAGGTGMDNRYFIDGIDVTDPYRGVTGTNLPYNFIKEIEVNAGGYQAEYRSSLGGNVNVITHSGGNEFHGRLFGFFANNRFAGDPRLGAYEPATGDFTQYDVGLSVGGPIARDALWFVAAYNPTVEREDVEIPGVGFHEDKYIAHIFAGKLNWKTTEKLNLDLTVFGDPTYRDGVGQVFGAWGIPASLDNPDPYLSEVKMGGINGMLTARYLKSDGALFDAFASRTIRYDRYLAATDRGKSETLFIDNETGIWSGGFPSPTDDKSTQTSIGASGTFFASGHQLKFGMEYKENRLDIDEVWRSLDRYSDTLFVDALFSIRGTVRNRVPTVYAQDSWQMNKRLRINYGLRWDGQLLIGSDGEVAQKILDTYQPRVGFVYQPGEIGVYKVYGSYGRFYHDLATSLSVLYHVEGSIAAFTTCNHDPRPDPSGCDVWVQGSTMHPEVDDLKGQYYDEFTLGFKQLAGSSYEIGIRGVYRALGRGIEDGYNVETDKWSYGNPGYPGPMSGFPKMKREYVALELTLDKPVGAALNFRSSYVLSRTYGNYPGLFNSDYGYTFPNNNGAFDLLEITADGTGLLPNDRTHILKFSGSYRFDFGLTFGTSLAWQSGTPLSEFGGSENGPPYYNFMQTRGEAGRTDSIWDANLRLAYDLASLTHTEWRPRLLLDIFHLGSRRTPVNYDQIHYFALDEEGNQIYENPNYGQPTRYQPPTAARLGMEIDF